MEMHVVYIMDVYVVKHQVVFTGVSVTRLNGHGDHGAYELHFLVCQVEAVFIQRQTVVKEHALLKQKGVSANPRGQLMPVLHYSLDVHSFGLVL